MGADELVDDGESDTDACCGPRARGPVGAVKDVRAPERLNRPGITPKEPFIAESLVKGYNKTFNKEIGCQRFSDEPPTDITAIEVLANIDAMAAAGAIRPEDPITVDPLLDIHQRLLAGSRLAEHGGTIRHQQT